MPTLCLCFSTLVCFLAVDLAPKFPIMLSRISLILSFRLISLICQTSLSLASHARLPRGGYHHLARDTDFRDVQQGVEARRDMVYELTKRQGATVEIPLDDIQLLRSEITAFGQRMSALLAPLDDSTSTNTINVLQQDITAYEGRIQGWLDLARVMSAGSTESSALLVSVSLSTSLPILGTQSYQQVKTYVSRTPNVGSASSTKPTSLKTLKTVVVQARTTMSTSTNVSRSPIAAITMSSKTRSPSPRRNDGYTFDPDASDNVAVYYGQTAATGQINLTSLCEDPSVDIVILAFLTQFFGPGGYPTVNFGAACGGQSPEQQQAGASGLLSCTILAAQVSTCQTIGKKVLLSLAGAISSTSFSSDQQATQFAGQLWNLFGGGSGYSTGLRPLGSFKVDGFDIGKPLETKPP